MNLVLNLSMHVRSTSLKVNQAFGAQNEERIGMGEGSQSIDKYIVEQK